MHQMWVPHLRQRSNSRILRRSLYQDYWLCTRLSHSSLLPSDSMAASKILLASQMSLLDLWYHILIKIVYYPNARKYFYLPKGRHIALRSHSILIWRSLYTLQFCQWFRRKTVHKCQTLSHNSSGLHHQVCRQYLCSHRMSQPRRSEFHESWTQDGNWPDLLDLH